MDGMLGRKLGMTQIYKEDGTVVPVTVIKAGPCLVVQRKTAATDGYEAVQLGLVEERPSRNISKPERGHFAKAGVPPTRRVMEFSITDGEEVKPGDEVKVSIFEEKQYVDVVGTSKGKGYQGVVKRHGFAGMSSSHGVHKTHRAPGSIGACATPSRVFKGMRMAGRMGGVRQTTQNLTIHAVDADRGLLLIKGAVPGPRGGIVLVRTAAKGA